MQDLLIRKRKGFHEDSPWMTSDVHSSLHVHLVDTPHEDFSINGLA